MGLFLIIAGAIAAGALIAYAIVLTFKVLRDKFRTLLAKKNVKKVAAMDLEKLIEECPNQRSLEDLYNDDYTDIVASVDDSGKVIDVEAIKDDSYVRDSDIEKMYGDERMVVIT